MDGRVTLITVYLHATNGFCFSVVALRMIRSVKLVVRTKRHRHEFQGRPVTKKKIYPCPPHTHNNPPPTHKNRLKALDKVVNTPAMLVNTYGLLLLCVFLYEVYMYTYLYTQHFETKYICYLTLPVVRLPSAALGRCPDRYKISPDLLNMT